MKQEETWKDIPTYLGLYQASNLGRIRTFPKNVEFYNSIGENVKTTLGGEIVAQIENKNGYIGVNLLDKNNRSFQLVHRLVAMAFIPNPKQLPCVNHKDENPHNNSADNLEWCSYEYNSNYGTAIERRKKKQRKFYKKNIEMLTVDGVLIKTFHNFIEIEEYFNKGDVHGNIIAVCKGRRNKCLGYKWRIVDEK